MKKIFLSIFTLLLFVTSAKAQEYTDFCAKEPYDVGNSFTQFVSNVTGLNFIKSKVFETSLQKALKSELSSDFNVEVYPFGEKSLSEGKFKKVTIESKHITSPSLYITDFKAESLCPYNKVNLKDENFHFDENFVAKFEGKITSDDMKKMLEDKIQRAGKLHVKIGNLSLFKVVNPDVSIKNKRINIDFDIEYSTIIVTKTTHAHVDTALTVKNGEITFSDTKFNSNYAINTQTISPIINMINPFNKKIKIDEYNTAELKINRMDFEENEIVLEGIVYVPAYKKN